MVVRLVVVLRHMTGPKNQRCPPCPVGASSHDIAEKLTAQPWCQEPTDLQGECDQEAEVHLEDDHEDLELLPWLHKPPLHAWPVPHVPPVLPQCASAE